MADNDTAIATAFTVVFGVCVFVYLWPVLDMVSRGLVGMLACIAALSIYNGTWMMNHRDLKRQARDDRREAIQTARQWMGGKRKQG